MKRFIINSMLALAALLIAAPASWAVERNATAVSPFAQIVPGGASAGGFYTFMAFTHPSLSTATSTVEVTVSLEGPTDANFADGSTRSSTFSIGAGETHKVFIVGTNHPSINPTTNASAFTARDHFIATTSGGAVFGNVRVQSTNSTPTDAISNKYNNLNQISIWGVIFAEANSAGFAMEFIGDMHDSTIPNKGNGDDSVTVQTGRGVN